MRPFGGWQVLGMLALLAAEPPPPGAMACSGCHGARTVPPTLAGRAARDISDAMAEFKAGTRAATVMDRIAKGFGPSETDAIAAWWSRRR
jgi:cytochrome c553